MDAYGRGTVAVLRCCTGPGVRHDQMVTESWTIRHFSQSNPSGTGQGDVPALLRRVAASVEALGPVEVQDIAFHSESDDDGYVWPSMTVYFHLVEGSSDP